MPTNHRNPRQIRKHLALLEASAKIARLVQISEEGMQLGSNWLLKPPVRDEMFAARLNREKRRGLLLQRVKLDPFHWQDRYWQKAMSYLDFFKRALAMPFVSETKGMLRSSKSGSLRGAWKNYGRRCAYSEVVLNPFHNVRCYSPKCNVTR